MMRWLRALSVPCIIALGMLALLGSAPAAQAQTNERCFTETGYCIKGRIRSFWEQNGGLPVFGYPLSAELNENDRVVQYFERQRFELHPENQAPYDVLLGRLGVEVLARNGIDWQTQPTSPGAVAGCRWFPETRHNVCDQQVGNGFLNAWSQNGLEFDGRPGKSYAESLALFGLPITEAYQDIVNGATIQVMWFERGRFEWHPNNPAAYRVLFGRLGAEIRGTPLAVALPQPVPAAPALAGTAWQLTSFGPASQPQPAVADAPATLRFGTDDQVSGTTGCNGFGGTYTAAANQVTFGPLIGTLIACNENISQQEAAIFSALQGTVRYEIASSTLRIYYNQDQSLLTYQATPAATAAVTGTVTYRERIALPAGAVMTVRLLDTSRQDAPAVILAQQVITTTGQQIPIAFTLAYDPARISASGTYSVRADISMDGQLLFTTTDAYLVITQGRPTQIEVLVHPPA